MRIGTPVNQIRLTNVAYVRLNKNGKRFEIAAYRNKVLSYRNKVETDLSEVLQIDTVFTNVTKGLLANSKDLIEAFGTADQILVCKEILEKGDLQVSEQERVALLDSTFRDVASIVADKSINPENNRPYTVSMIQNAMRQIHYSVNVSKSSKSQALDVIRKLKAVMPIARASMLLRIICPLNYSESMKEILLKEFNVNILSQGIQGQTNNTSDTSDVSNSNNVFLEFKFDTELFRKLEETVQQHTNNEGILEVLQLRTSSGPSDNNNNNNSNNNTNTTNTTNEDNNMEIDQILPKIEKKSKDVISKSELKRLERNNDFKGKSNKLADEDTDDDSNGEEEDETVFGIVKKNKKAKKKKKNTDNDKNDNKINQGNELNNEDDDDDDDDADDKADNKSSKRSKKAKRLEKEAKKEREIKESKLKERLENEKAKREATTSNSVSTDVSSSSLSSNITQATTITATATATTSSSSKCNTCGGSFPDATSYRAHFKSEWHRYNLNRKMKNLSIVSSEEEFAKLSFDEINSASISSGQTNG